MKSLQKLGFFKFGNRDKNVARTQGRRALIEALEDRQLLALDALSIGGVALTDAQLNGGVSGTGYVYAPGATRADSSTLTLDNFESVYSIKAKGNLTIVVDGECLIVVDAAKNAIEVDGNLTIEALNNAPATTGTNPTAAVATDVLSTIGGVRATGTFTVEGTDATTGAPTAISPRVNLGDVAVTHYVASFAQLQQAWSAANTAKKGAIVVVGDVDGFGSSLTVNSGVSITLATVGDRTITRGSSFNGALFVVNSSAHGYNPTSKDANKIDRTAELTLGLERGMGTNALTIDGGATWNDASLPGAGKATGSRGSASGALVYDAGTLNMYAGIALKNNYSTQNGAGVFVDGYNKSYTIDESTGFATPTVEIDAAGTAVFNMRGGTIAGNYSSLSGGGVATFGEFNFSGGKIESNFAEKEGGGVYVKGGMSMDGGAILKCGTGVYDNSLTVKTDYGKGGGVHNSTYGYVRVCGASTISGCYGYHGGAMYVGGNGTARTYLLGGTIAENTAYEGGAIATNSTVVLGGSVDITLNEAYFVDNANRYRDASKASVQKVAKLEATRGLGDGLYVFAVTNSSGAITISATGAAQVLIGGGARVNPTNDVYFSILTLTTTSSAKINNVSWNGEPLVPVYVYSKLTCEGAAMLINTAKDKDVYDPANAAVADKLQLSSMPIVRFANDLVADASKFAVVSSYWEITQVVKDCNATVTGSTYTNSNHAGYVEYLDYMNGKKNNGTTALDSRYYLGKGAPSSPSQYLAFYAINESASPQVRINDMVFDTLDDALDFVARHFGNTQEGTLKDLGLLDDGSTSDVGGSVTLYLMQDTTVAYSHRSTVDITVNIVAETEASNALARLRYGDYANVVIWKDGDTTYYGNTIGEANLSDDQIVEIERGLRAKKYLTSEAGYKTEDLEKETAYPYSTRYETYQNLAKREINVAFLKTLYALDDASTRLYTDDEIADMTADEILLNAEAIRAYDYLITVHATKTITTSDLDEDGNFITYEEELPEFKYSKEELYDLWVADKASLLQLAYLNESDIDLDGFAGKAWVTQAYNDYRRCGFELTISNATLSPTTVTVGEKVYSYYAFGASSQFTSESKETFTLSQSGSSYGGVYVLNGRVVESFTYAGTTYNSEFYRVVDGQTTAISIESGFVSFADGTVTINDVVYDAYSSIYWNLPQDITVSISDVFQPYVSVYANREKDDPTAWKTGNKTAFEYASGARNAAFVFSGNADGDAATSTKINLGGNGGRLVVDGYYRYAGSQMLFYITNDASMTINAGTTIRNVRSSGTLEQYDAAKLSFGGAGAIVVYDGTLTVNDGVKIADCGGYHAGAIYVGKAGEFVMNGGKITGNVGVATNEVGDAPDLLKDYTGAGAIYNAGTTTINAGTISGNAGRYGAIYNNEGGVLTISNVVMKNNTNHYDATAPYVGNGVNVLRGNVAIYHAGQALTFADGADGSECSLDVDGLIYLGLGARVETYGGWKSASHQITVTSTSGDLLADGAKPIALDSYDATGGARLVVVDADGDATTAATAADVARTGSIANSFTHLASAVLQESQLDKDSASPTYLTVDRANYLMLGLNKVYYVNETNGAAQVDCEYVAEKNLLFDMKEIFGVDFTYDLESRTVEKTETINGVATTVTYVYTKDGPVVGSNGRMTRSWRYNEAHENETDVVDVTEFYDFYNSNNLVGKHATSTRTCESDHYLKESGQEYGAELFPSKAGAGFTKFVAGADNSYVDVWFYGTSDESVSYVAPDDGRPTDYKGPERFAVSLDNPTFVHEGVEYGVAFDGSDKPIKITAYKNNAAYSVENKDFGSFTTRVDSVTNSYGYTCNVSPIAWGRPLSKTTVAGNDRLTSPKSETENYVFESVGTGNVAMTAQEKEYVYTVDPNDPNWAHVAGDLDKTYYALQNDYVANRKFYVAVTEWDAENGYATKAIAYLFYEDAAGNVDYMEKYLATYVDGVYVMTAFRTNDSNSTEFAYWTTFENGVVSPSVYTGINFYYRNAHGETITQSCSVLTAGTSAVPTNFTKTYENSSYVVNYAYDETTKASTGVTVAENWYMDSNYVYGFSGDLVYGLKSSTDANPTTTALDFAEREANVVGTGAFSLADNAFFRSWNTARDGSGTPVYPNVDTVELGASDVVLYADVVSSNVVNTTYDEFTLTFDTATGKWVDSNEWTSLREAIFLTDFNETQNGVAGYAYDPVKSRIAIESDPAKWQNAKAENFAGYGLETADLAKYVWTSSVGTTYYFPETMNFVLTGGRIGTKTGEGVYSWTGYQTTGSITIHTAVSLDFTSAIESSADYGAYVAAANLDATTGATAVRVTMEENDPDTPSRIFSVIADGTTTSKTIKNVVYDADAPDGEKYSLGTVYATSEPTSATKTVRFVGLDFYDGGAYSTTNKLNGGAIMTTAGSFVYVADCEFVDNKGYMGGAIANQGTTTLKNCAFKSTASNTWASTTDGLTSVCNDAKLNAYAGGGVYNTGSLTMTNATFRGLSVKGVGGGIANSAITKNGETTKMGTIVGSGVDVALCIAYSYEVTVDDTTKTAGGYGGGMANFGVATFADSYFRGNYAEENGGGITNAYKTVGGQTSSLELTNCYVSSNDAGYFGGGLLNASTATIVGSQFQNNYANRGNGGAIYNAWYGEAGAPAKYTRDGVDASDDIIAVGALTITANGSTVSTFVGNSASGYGGAIADSGKSLSVSGTIFSSANPNDARYGAVLTTSRGTATSDGVQLNDGVFAMSVVYPANATGKRDQIFVGESLELGQIYFDPVYSGVTPNEILKNSLVDPAKVANLYVTNDGANWFEWKLDQTLAQSGVDLHVGENRLWAVIVDVDGVRSETITMNATVVDDDPTVSVDVASGADSSVLRLAASVVAGSPIQRWTINWGDGQTSVCDELSFAVNFGHYYAAPGLYNVTMELQNANGFGEGVVYSLVDWAVDAKASDVVASNAVSSENDERYEIADVEYASDSLALASVVDRARTSRPRLRTAALDSLFESAAFDEETATSNATAEELDDDCVAEIAASIPSTSRGETSFEFGAATTKNDGDDRLDENLLFLEDSLELL